MAQTGQTTLQTYYSTTASATPAAGSLVVGELAVNVTDKRIFTKDGGGNVVETGTNPSTISTPGNVAFTGTGNRITGDFSNATVANRVMFQTSTANGNTEVSLIPNGTSITSRLSLYPDSSPLNSSRLALRVNITDAAVMSDIIGTGTYLPMAFYTNGAKQAEIPVAGGLHVTQATGLLGYGTGAGGTVTQATSKSTGVTLNKPCGQITMNNAALGAGASVTFVLTNSLIGAADCVFVNAAGNANYRVENAAVASGNVTIRVTNTTAGSLSDALLINFAIIQGTTS